MDLFWGRVADAYEGDPSLSTIRSETFLLPAGNADVDAIPPDPPMGVFSAAWKFIHGEAFDTIGEEFKKSLYAGQNNFAAMNKFQSTLQGDPVNGPARIHTLIWTDFVANNLVGSATSDTLMVAPNLPSVAFDLRYGIPALLLLLIWGPVFLVVVVIFFTGSMRFSYMRMILDHTSVGRAVLGDSYLRALDPLADDTRAPHHEAIPAGEQSPESLQAVEVVKSAPTDADWQQGAGRTLLILQASTVVASNADISALSSGRGGWTAVSTRSN